MYRMIRVKPFFSDDKLQLKKLLINNAVKYVEGIYLDGESSYYSEVF